MVFLINRMYIVHRNRLPRDIAFKELINDLFSRIYRIQFQFNMQEKQLIYP